MNKDDSWLIVGPGRTGSKVIVDVILSSYRRCRLPFKYIPPGEYISAAPGNVLHSHNVEDLALGYSKRILSTRDCVESAISWCIQPYVGEWHLYENLHREKLSRIKPFILDPALVLNEYNKIKHFYENVRYYITPETIKIDYSEFQYNNTLLLKRLELDTSTPLRFMPIRNPGAYSDWIYNWDEVWSAVKYLPTKLF